MSLFPRFVSHDFPRITSSDFAPVWRLIDDYANQVVSARNGGEASRLQTFNPRFDVKEVEGAYELKGELPGVEQKNIEIEFSDQRTIVIKGSTGYSREAATPAAEAQAPAEDPTPSEASHQPTVEDEPEIIDASEATSEGTPEATPAATPQTQVAQPAADDVVPGKYWVTERFTGSFQRSFSFPAPVDVDAVKARLNNGLLEITIPKIQKAGTKRITVE